MLNDHQACALRRAYTRTGRIGRAAQAMGIDRKTASKYLSTDRLPSQTRPPRNWRTRPNPFEAHWPFIVEFLKDAPELEATALFDHLCLQHPGVYEPGQLRTLQRHISNWRASEGPEKRIFLPQCHRPGEAFQTDFTHANKLGITIDGETFDHLLCQVVLPYSNWRWVTVCHSESIEAIRRGVQAALFELGYVPAYHQTDNSSAATHSIGPGKREFNERYLDIMNHFGLKPRTTEVGAKEQNGDVEALNGSLKRRLKQHLLIRRSSDFESIEAYERWVQAVCVQSNTLRQTKLAEEVEQMKPLVARRLAEFTEETPRVSRNSTIQVKANTYSVPSRLSGKLVRVHVFENWIEVYFQGRLELDAERFRGRRQARIDYRHVIASLVRHPGGFQRYKYREAMFPTLTFRRAYDGLCERFSSQMTADIEYLQILNLAAQTMECEVEQALELVLEEGQTFNATLIEQLVSNVTYPVPESTVPPPDLNPYDSLLELSSEQVA